MLTRLQPHAPRRGTMGVVDPAAAAPTVRARHEVRQAPAAVVDNRGWPVPTHELVREGDELVLYGPALDLATKRACLLVIRAPDGTWHRPLTDRELAVLQGFPVDTQLEGPSSSAKGRAGRREHIGNAIPPPTAEAIAREAAATLRSTAQAGFLGPPLQPAILVLAGASYLEGWVARAEALGVRVDAPLAGMTLGARRSFARRFVAETPSWRDVAWEEEVEWGSRREQLLGFVNALDMEVALEDLPADPQLSQLALKLESASYV